MAHYIPCFLQLKLELSPLFHLALNPVQKVSNILKELLTILRTGLDDYLCEQKHATRKRAQKLSAILPRF